MHYRETCIWLSKVIDAIRDVISLITDKEKPVGNVHIHLIDSGYQAEFTSTEYRQAALQIQRNLF